MEWVREENYFFRMKQQKNAIIRWLQDNPHVIRPSSRYNEVMSHLSCMGVEDLSISRQRSKVSWGIPVPSDPTHTVYVWFEALLNYLTAARDCSLQRGVDIFPPDYQIVGKDILK